MKIKGIRRLITLALIIVLGLIFTFTADYFLTARNISQLFREASYTGLLAVGMSFVMIGGGIDLSLGGIVCVVGIICERMSFLGLPGIVIFVIAILAGCLCGFINSLLVTRLHMTEFVATLASGFVYSGLALMLAFREGNAVVSVSIENKGVLFFGQHIGLIYYITIAWVIVTIVAMVVLTRTKFGTHTYANGSNALAARMTGVNNTFIKTSGFLISGGLAGVASIMVVAFQGSASVSLGEGMEFQAIAACVVGGIVMSGGKGDALGAAMGAIFMVLLSNGLNKFGLSAAWQYVYQGAIIILATGFDAWFKLFADNRRKKMTRKDLERAHEKLTGGVT